MALLNYLCIYCPSSISQVSCEYIRVLRMYEWSAVDVDYTWCIRHILVERVCVYWCISVYIDVCHSMHASVGEKYYIQIVWKK